MRNRSPHAGFPFLFTLLICCDSLAQEDAAQVYISQVKPLLAEKCYSCHGALRQESNLRLETRDLIFSGGDGGSTIDLETPLESEILLRVLATDDSRMPPEGEGAALNQDEVDLLQSWIEAGALAPKEEVPAGPNEHWAFQPPACETQKRTIDSILDTRRRSKGLIASPPANRSIALRRIYLDLIGLPPTLEQLQDDRPWEAIVEELLASPQHGERWARHWMDIWRYCDDYGLGEQLRYSQKHMWHWRDWIIDSINAEKGYDRMITEMLAGDELAPNDEGVVVATGFLARNYYLFNRTTWLDAHRDQAQEAGPLGAGWPLGPLLPPRG
ncbi:MAG: DUF1549 domain-containing protein [Planctomycetota bacterium]